MEKKVRQRTASQTDTAQHLKVLRLLGLTPAERSKITSGGGKGFQSLRVVLIKKAPIGATPRSL